MQGPLTKRRRPPARTPVDDDAAGTAEEQSEVVYGARIAFDSVRFNYPTGLCAVDGMTLGVRPGSTVGVVGPSGCGKSTLLALLAGLREPGEGRVTVDSDGSKRHLRTMMFQTDTLLPWLTVVENVKLYYRFNKGDRRDVESRVRDLVSLAKLNGFESTYPYQLSGGMRRRVAFLASVAPRPQSLLLDEPFSSLDEPTRVAIHQDAFRILQKSGITTVLVTHDLAEAATMCDRVIILTNRPAKVYSDHTVPFGPQRDMLSLRESAEFLEFYRMLWRDLSAQIRSGEQDNGND